MKRAIYFDDRERDLARRIFDYVDTMISFRVNDNPNATINFALKSTRIEVATLAAKFAEKNEGKNENG